MNKKVTLLPSIKVIVDNLRKTLKKNCYRFGRNSTGVPCGHSLLIISLSLKLRVETSREKVRMSVIEVGSL